MESSVIRECEVDIGNQINSASIGLMNIYQTVYEASDLWPETHEDQAEVIIEWFMEMKRDGCGALIEDVLQALSREGLRGR